MYFFNHKCFKLFAVARVSRYWQLVASPVVTKQSGFGVAPSIWGPQLHFSAIGGKPVKLFLMSHLHKSNLAMADFSRGRIEQIPLLQPLVLRESFGSLSELE